MQHLVRFATPDGRDGHHVAESLEEALQFVEHLRNAEDAGEVRLYRLTEVPIEFRTYFKVEVRAGDGEELAMPPPPAVATAPQTGTVAVVAAGPASTTVAGVGAPAPDAPFGAGTPGAPSDAPGADSNGRRLFTRA